MRSDTAASSAAALGSGEDAYVWSRDWTVMGTDGVAVELVKAELADWAILPLGEMAWDIELDGSGR